MVARDLPVTLQSSRDSSARDRLTAECNSGGVSEWSKVTVLKTVVAQATVGSNPTPSATILYLLVTPSPSSPSQGEGEEFLEEGRSPS